MKIDDPKCSLHLINNNNLFHDKFSDYFRQLNCSYHHTKDANAKESNVSDVLEKESSDSISLR